MIKYKHEIKDGVLYVTAINEKHAWAVAAEEYVNTIDGHWDFDGNSEDNVLMYVDKATRGTIYVRVRIGSSFIYTTFPDKMTRDDIAHDRYENYGPSRFKIIPEAEYKLNK